MTIKLSAALILTFAASLSISGARAQDAGEFCGRAGGEPAAILADVSKIPGIKEVHRGAEYVAYQDEATQTVFTFTTEGAGAAHPAAVCRKPVKDGDSLKLQMVIVCKGESESCQRLESDFKKLNAQMEAAIRNQTTPDGAQK